MGTYYDGSYCGNDVLNLNGELLASESASNCDSVTTSSLASQDASSVTSKGCSANILEQACDKTRVLMSSQSHKEINQKSAPSCSSSEKVHDAGKIATDAGLDTQKDKDRISGIQLAEAGNISQKEEAELMAKSPDTNFHPVFGKLALKGTFCMPLFSLMLRYLLSCFLLFYVIACSSLWTRTVCGVCTDIPISGASVAGAKVIDMGFIHSTLCNDELLDKAEM